MKKATFLILVTGLILCGCNEKAEKNVLKDYSTYFKVESGKPAEVMMTAYSTTLLANGTDIARLRIVVTDSLEREITSVNQPVDISVSGDATLLHPDLGKKLIFNERYDSVIIWQSSIQEGICEVFLQSGTTPGKIRIEAKCNGLDPVSCIIHIIPEDFRLMKPSADQIKTAGESMEPMLGADISLLPQFESRGRKFYDNGVSKDGITALKDHGFNYVRLMIFVNPEDPGGYSPGEGYCGLESTKEMARRIKDAGMHLLLAFQYSDRQADQQHQCKPAEWEDLDFEALKTALSNYTTMVLQELGSQGTLPEIVQIGNEINHGMVWPEGYIGNPDNLAQLIIAGHDAVKKVSPDIITMVHLALGGQNHEATFWLDNMIARGVDFDLLGLTYYPGMQGTLNDMNSNVTDLTESYGIPVTVAGYSSFREQVNEIVFSLPGNMGEGTCIDEPLSSRGVFFDTKGSAMPELEVFDELAAKYLR